MAEYIEREALLAEYDRQHTGEPGRARKLIEDAHTIDAVPVVRCKDCKHWTVDGAGNRWCHMWETHQTHEDVFCCFGERKDGEG